MKLAGKIVKPQNSGNFDFHPLFKISILNRGWKSKLPDTICGIMFLPVHCPGYLSIRSTVQSQTLQVTLSVTRMGKKDVIKIFSYDLESFFATVPKITYIGYFSLHSI